LTNFFKGTRVEKAAAAALAESAKALAKPRAAE
jgi:hypothetical protein